MDFDVKNAGPDTADLTFSFQLEPWLKVTDSMAGLTCRSGATLTCTLKALPAAAARRFRLGGVADANFAGPTNDVTLSVRASPTDAEDPNPANNEVATMIRVRKIAPVAGSGRSCALQRGTAAAVGTPALLGVLLALGVRRRSLKRIGDTQRR
jgi:hypothetical protein